MYRFIYPLSQLGCRAVSSAPQIPLAAHLKPYSLSPATLPCDTLWSIFHHWNFPGLECYVNGIIWCNLLKPISSSSIMHLGVIQVFMFQWFAPLIVQYSIGQMHHRLFILPPTEGLLACSSFLQFWIELLVNIYCMNICFQFSRVNIYLRVGL